MMCFVDDSNDTSPFVIRSVARRKTDLIPTIPIRDSNFGSRTSLYCSTPRTQGKPQHSLTQTNKQNPLHFHTFLSPLPFPPFCSSIFHLSLLDSCCFCCCLSLSLPFFLSHFQTLSRWFYALNATWGSIKHLMQMCTKYSANVVFMYQLATVLFCIILFSIIDFFSFSAFFIRSVSIVSTFHNLSFDNFFFISFEF